MGSFDDLCPFLMICTYNGAKSKMLLKDFFAVYGVPKTKTLEAIQFILQFDFETIVQQVIDSMLASLEHTMFFAENK